MNIIKRIWNFLFPKKNEIITGKVELSRKKIDWDIQSKVIEQKIVLPKYHHKMSFNKQQLAGKIITDGKDRFKVHELIVVGNKFKYYINKLT